MQSFKMICTHCGRKQTAVEVDYSFNYVPCKFCKKEGELWYYKPLSSKSKSDPHNCYYYEERKKK